MCHCTPHSLFARIFSVWRIMQLFLPCQSIILSIFFFSHLSGRKIEGGGKWEASCAVLSIGKVKTYSIPPVRHLLSLSLLLSREVMTFQRKRCLDASFWRKVSVGVCHFVCDFLLFRFPSSSSSHLINEAEKHAVIRWRMTTQDVVLCGIWWCCFLSFLSFFPHTYWCCFRCCWLLYEEVFRTEIPLCQSIVSSLLLRDCEKRRKTQSTLQPPFLRWSFLWLLHCSFVYDVFLPE